MKRLLFILITITAFTSCSSYVDRIHRELDRDNEMANRQRYKQNQDAFKNFRNREQYKGYAPSSAPINNLTSSRQRVVQPNVKRQYQPSSNPKRRLTSNDLLDNSSTGSLWAGQGNENYLFTKNKWKKNGDIVLVNVKKDLKKEVQLELKRAFPEYPSKKNKDDKAETAAAEPAASQPAAAEGQDTPDKVYDRVSSVITEEISKDHLLIRGQKLLLYKNRKRLVEVQALISRKDISDDDTVNSDKFLESTVTVIR